MDFIDHEAWQSQMQRSFTSLDSLVKAGFIAPDSIERLQNSTGKNAIRITPYYATLFGPSHLPCPIRMMAIPQLEEQDPELPEWVSQLSQKMVGSSIPWQKDPIGDLQKLAAPRLTHRYHNRAILHLTSQCAVFCRFCFRKSIMNDPEKPLYRGNFEPALQYLKENPSIEELILTGGDPLSCGDDFLANLFEDFSKIQHLRTLRIHTRMLVTLPYRVTAKLIDVLSQRFAFQVVLVNHFNHPKELTVQSLEAIRKLKKASIQCFNQSVLLKGVNADSTILAELFQKLYHHGVLPLYLHHPDWTPGTFFQRVSIKKGRALFENLSGTLSGPALPHYVLDVPGGAGKIPVLSASLKLVKQIKDSMFMGALYQGISSQTKKGKTPFYYLDLAPRED